MADANERFALYQAVGSVIREVASRHGNLLDCSALRTSIGRRRDSLRKLHYCQAWEILNRTTKETHIVMRERRATAVAQYWISWAHDEGQQVWRHLYGDIPMPPIDEHEALLAFIGDRRLMGLLGLKPGLKGLKKIDPAMDSKSADNKGLNQFDGLT